MRLSKFCMILCLAIVMAFAARPSRALVLASPTEDQIVRESVRITVPLKSLPAEMIPAAHSQPIEKKRPFISIEVDDGTSPYFVAALSGDMGVVRGDNVSFFWDSKAAYRDPKSPKVDRFFKDGQYTLRVKIHDREAKTIDSASVKVQLKNKVPRSNPAPAIMLANRLEFGQTRIYGVHADVQVFEMVSGYGLPILGGLGMASDFKVIQTVDDIRDDHTLLLRYRIDKGARVNSFGQKRVLYEGDKFGPQLYRLVSKLGKVVKRNVFTRQAEYTITDVLPILPANPVKEGDSWPCAMTLKIEGITNPITFGGTSMLDSFEWQGGHECAKIVSRMTGNGTIMLAGGKIRSQSSKVEAQMTTYFAYRSGTLLRNEIMLDFPAIILPGAGEPGSEQAQPEVSQNPSGIPRDTSEEEVFNRPPGAATNPSTPGSVQGLPEGSKKGSVQINLVVRLEK